MPCHRCRKGADSPAVLLGVHFKADGGVMITGSHNPPEYNGFKRVAAQALCTETQSRLSIGSSKTKISTAVQGTHKRSILCPLI